MLYLLGLQRGGQLQGQKSLHHVVAMWRGCSLVAGGLGHVTPMEEIVALHDERLDDGLVELGGGQRVPVLKVRTHEGGPETDGQVVGRHQGGLAMLAHPDQRTNPQNTTFRTNKYQPSDFIHK